MINAVFFPLPQQHRLALEMRNGVVGMLVPVADPALVEPASAVLQGESLSAIRTAHSITPSPLANALQAARDATAKRAGRPQQISARQLRLWLLRSGLTLAAVEGQIAAIPNATARAEALVEWEYASVYRRDHPLVVQLGMALGLTIEQIDAAFADAAQF